MSEFKGGEKVRRVKHTPLFVHACPIGFETTVVKLKSNGVGFFYYDQDGNLSSTSETKDWVTITDGPVRFVMRREVVPGVYARVRVGSRQNDRVHVIFAADPDHAHKFTSKELRDASAVLLELAGALEGGDE